MIFLFRIGEEGLTAFYGRFGISAGIGSEIVAWEREGGGGASLNRH